MVPYRQMNIVINSLMVTYSLWHENSNDLPRILTRDWWSVQRLTHTAVTPRLICCTCDAGHPKHEPRLCYWWLASPKLWCSWCRSSSLRQGPRDGWITPGILPGISHEFMVFHGDEEEPTSLWFRQWSNHAEWCLMDNSEVIKINNYQQCSPRKLSAVIFGHALVAPMYTGFINGTITDSTTHWFANDHHLGSGWRSSSWQWCLVMPNYVWWWQ